MVRWVTPMTGAQELQLVEVFKIEMLLGYGLQGLAPGFLQSKPKIAAGRLAIKGHRKSIRLLAAGDGELNPEEQQFYDEFLAKKRAERKRTIQDAKRRIRPIPAVQPPESQPATPPAAEHQQAPAQPAPQSRALDTPVQVQVTDTWQANSPAKSSTPTAGAPLKRRGLTRQSGRAMAGRSMRAPLPMRTSRQAPRMLDGDNEEAGGEGELDLSDPNVMSALDQIAQQLLQDGALEEALVEDEGGAGRKKLQPGTADPSIAPDSMAESPRTLTNSQASTSGRGQTAGKAAGSKARQVNPLEDPSFLQQMEAIMNTPDDELEDDDPNEDADADDLAALLGQRTQGKGSGAGASKPPAAGAKEKLVNMDDIDW